MILYKEWYAKWDKIDYALSVIYYKWHVLSQRVNSMYVQNHEPVQTKQLTERISISLY